VAFSFLSSFLHGVPALFKLAQGGADWSAHQRADDGTWLTAEQAARELKAALTSIDEEANVAPLLESVSAALTKQQELVLANAKATGEAILPLSATYSDADLPKAREICVVKLQQAVDRLRKCIKRACDAVKRCQGAAKLAEAITGQEVKRRFMLHTAPSVLPVKNDDMFAYLGVPVAMRTFANATKLRAEWAVFQRDFVVPASRPSLKQAAEFWVSMMDASCMPTVAVIALRHLTAPMSSASVERVFSILTDMDTAKTRKMKPRTVARTLFLRANKKVVRGLLDKQAVLCMTASASSAPAVSGAKRSAQTAGIKAASERLHAGKQGSAAKKRKLDASDASDDSAIVVDDSE